MNPEDILQTCIEDVLAGRKTPAQCAALYPQLPGLEAQLQLLTALRAGQTAMPRLEADRRIEAALRKKAASRQPARPTTARGRSGFGLLRWAVVAILVAVFGLGGAGLAAAADDSLPGDALYPVKRAGESVQLLVTPPGARAAYHARLAHRRLDEVSALARRTGVRPDHLDLGLADLASETEAALAAAPAAATAQQAAVLNSIVALADRQQTVLAEVRASAPPQAQAALAHALEVSGRARQNALEHLQRRPQGPGAPGGSAATPAPPAFRPTFVPPGLARKTETAAAATPAAPPGQTPAAPPGHAPRGKPTSAPGGMPGTP